ncbi:MAG TPA: hypothetical protein VJP59_08060 [Gemmatimonadota bacterium]|nr:hypothetical protein [Gemmatimonadota bacterium]
MTRVWLPIAAAVGVLGGGCGASTDEPFLRQTFGFTFESDPGGWVADGTDLEDPPVTWSVERSDELAERGDWSMRLSLDNLNDAGKIWMERAFELQPGATYDVEVAFDFASADFGDIGLWTIVATVSEADPETVDDLVFRDDTGNGSGEDVGHVWGTRSYSLGTATADGEGLLWVALGVWGTFETSRTYFIDDLELTFTLR